MRVLQTAQPIPGHLNPALALAQALEMRGHEAAIYTGERGRSAVEGGGWKFYPFQPSMDAILSDILLPSSGASRQSTLVTEKIGIGSRKAMNETLRAWLLETVPQQIEDLEAAIVDFKPDVLVSDVSMMGPLLILKDKLEIPTAVYSVLAGCSIPGRNDPPWGKGLPPARSFWTKFSYRVMTAAGQWMLADLRRSANDLRRRYGLPPMAGRISDEYARVPLFTVASTPSFDYSRSDLPSNVHYVGACIWDGGRSQEIPSWLEELKPEPPVVHVTEGTVFTREPVLLRAGIEGLAGLDMQVNMSTGKHRRPEDLDFGELPSNIRIDQFVPHGYLFKKTSAVVTNGGAGTVLTALVAGSPLVIVPNAWELPENAQRVAEAGAGIRIEPEELSAEKLRHAVETILGDSSYRENARRIGNELTELGGAHRAAELVEELGVGRPHTRTAAS